MRQVVSATEARIHLGELIRQVVERKEPVIVERGGRPQVVVLPLDVYERLRAAQKESDTWEELVKRARKQIRAEIGKRDLPSPEVIIRKMRTKRDARLVDLR